MRRSRSVQWRVLLRLAGIAVFVGFCLAAPATPAGAYPPTVCATLSVSTTAPQPGETITITGAHFQPHSTVQIMMESQHVFLASVTADANGSFTTYVSLPSGLSGTHQIVATYGGTPVSDCSPSIALGVSGIHTSGGSHPQTTAVTGVDVVGMLLGGAVLTGVGVVLSVSARRRRIAGSSLR